MDRCRGTGLAIVIAAALTAGCGGREPAQSGPAPSMKYDDLVTLFNEWRAFQPATLVDGVPDYRPPAMSAQRRELANFQRRLIAIDPSAWPIAQQVDHHIVRAEMNGLEFDHRVLQPWANDPAYYVTFFGDESDQPAREGNFARGGVEAWSYKLPLDAAATAEIQTRVHAIPALLDQAKTNLVGNGRDLWVRAVGLLRAQSTDLAEFAGKLGGDTASGLGADLTKAKASTDSFATWVESEAAKKTGPSGIGKDNYNWYLKHVELLPYTWDEVMTLMQRELARARASLVLEEQHNATIAPAMPAADAATYDRQFQDRVTEYMKFLKDHDVLTVRDYMDGALRARGGRFTPSPREFFTEVDHYDPMVMRTHGYHWFDKARMIADPHPSPIRKGPLLYNIFITRTEGHATGWEEMMLHAGMFDARPRSRELIWVLLAQRAARAQGDLRMHARLATLEEAAAFTSANTPRGWLRLDGNLVRGEQHLYLRQPAYGISYVVGKIQIEQLLADRKRQLGDRFKLREFMDEFDNAGLIPISLIRWQLTGEMSPDLKPVLGTAASK